MINCIKVPKERIAVVIGSSGNTKKKIEALTGCNLIVDSAQGTVTIEPAKKGVDVYGCRSIIRAIGRGFNPEKAMALADQSMLLEVLDLKDILSKGQFETKKGRVIGTRGTVREEICRRTGCEISVYGKTISIIGEPEQVPVCRRAVEMLLEGASHSAAYNFIEKKMHKTRETEFSV